MSEPDEIQLNLKWDNFSSHLALSFDSCYESQQFVDVSLVCKDGEVIKGHKMILANTSRFFRRLLTENEHPHPMIVLHSIDADDLRSLMTFMYCGEVQVFQNDLKKLLEIADTLEITGLQQIQELDNPAHRRAKNDRDCEMNSSRSNKPASNLLKYVSTLGQKNLDNSLQSFESSSKKLQQMARKFEKCSNVGSWSFLQQVPNSNETRIREVSHDSILKSLQKLPDGEPDPTVDSKSSSRKLQEMAKLLENINRNPALSEVSKGTSEGHKRSFDSEEATESPAKKPHLTQSTPNTSEAEPDIDTVGPSAAQDTSAGRNDEQLIPSYGVYIKDELEVNTDCSTTPDTDLDNLQTDNLNAANIGEHSGTSMLAAELLKAVANKRKDMPCTLLSSKPKPKRRSWDKVAMGQAIEAVREKKMGLREAAKKFSVPKTTLLRFVNSTLPPELVVDKKLGRRPVLPASIEEKLIEYLLSMKRQFYELTHADVRRLAYQLATKNHIEHPFNNNKAGHAWLDLFLKRHKINIPLRKATGASVIRVNKFSRAAVDSFFDILESEYREKNFTPDRIFNVGEIGFSVLQRKVPQVVVSRGQQQIESLTGAARDSLVTVVCAISPSGIFVPPMMIFPRKNMTDTLMRGASPGALGRCHPSGWIQTNLFTEWFQHFVKSTKPSATSPVLLILDGHNNHTKNIDVIDIARENHITIISIPPHSTHRMQPIHKTFMGPLKTYYGEEIQKWLEYSQRPLSPSDIAQLFAKAYHQCQTRDVAINCFNDTGIYPLNRGVFTNVDFTAAEGSSYKASYEPHPTDIHESASTTPKNSVVEPSVTAGSSHEHVSVESINKTAKRGRGRGRGRGRNRDSEDPTANCSSSRPDNSQTAENSDSDFDECDVNGNSSDTSSHCVAKTPGEKEATCIFCDKEHSTDNAGEVWILCESCGLWAHYNCAGCETEYYTCDFCK